MFRPYPNNLTASDWKIFTKGQIKIGAQEWNFRGILFVSKPFDIQKQYPFDSLKGKFWNAEPTIYFQKFYISSLLPHLYHNNKFL